MLHLIFVTLHRWLSGMQGGIPPRIPHSHLYRMTNTRYHIGTVFSPDDGHIDARNMYTKAINILRKFVHQVGSVYKKKIVIYFLFHRACIMCSPAYLLIQSSPYCVREVPGSNLDLDTGYLHVFFQWFPKSFQENCNIITWLHHDCFLPNPFQFITCQLSPLYNLIL